MTFEMLTNTDVDNVRRIPRAVYERVIGRLTNPMKYEALTNAEIKAVVWQLPEIVRNQIARENVVLAGGLIRDTVAGLPVKDVDIFCHSAEQAERLAREASPFVTHTLFAYSVDLGIPVQYVFYKEFTDAKDLISQFDFRACCAGIWYYTVDSEHYGWDGLAVEGFHTDCAAKKLHFMSQQKDAGKLTALGRALSLAKRGWTLSTAEAAAIITHFEPTFEPERVTYAFRPGYGGRR